MESSLLERNEDRSIVQNLEMMQIKEQIGTFDFPKKKSFKNLMNMKKVRVSSNLNSYSFNENVMNIWVYGVSINSNRDIIYPQTNKNEEDFKNYLFIIIKKTEEFIKYLSKYFSVWRITGNTIFAKPLDNSTIVYPPIYFSYKSNEKIQFILDQSISELSDNDCIYELNIKRADKKFNENISLVRTFINLSIASNLNKLGYKKSNFQKNYVYYKKLNNEKDVIFLNDKFVKNGYFQPGYRISSNEYENQKILLKCVHKYRLVREQTFYELFNQMRKNLDNFKNLVIGRKGLKIYDNFEINIDDVIYTENPRLITFIDDKTNLELNLYDYLLDMKKIKMNYFSQPILIQFDMKFNPSTGKKEKVKEIYFPSEFVFILGKFDHENLNVSNVKLELRKKYIQLNKIMYELMNNSVNKSSMIESMDVELDYKPVIFDTYVLPLPTIIFKNKKITPDIAGKISIEKIEPLENKPLSNWLLILLDTTFHEAKNIFMQMKNASEFLNISVESPIDKEIYVNPCKNEKEFRDFFDNLFLNYLNLEKTGKKKNYEMIVFMLSSNYKKVYPIFKNSLNRSKLAFPSQVIVKDKALSAKPSYYTNILFQILAKRGCPIWTVKMMKPNMEENVSIISYAISKMNKTQAVTSLSVSMDDECRNFIYHSEIHEYSQQFVSNVVQSILKYILNTINKHRKNPIENFVIYRDGLNESQLNFVRDIEVNSILDTIKEIYPNSKMCFISVNIKTDTKLFEIQNNLNKTKGFENFNPSFEDLDCIGNPPVGLLVESIITRNKFWDFYINSTFEYQATTTPTQYVVLYDNTNLSADFIYELTYNLTYLYYNNNKSVRIPGPLHNIIRRNKFIIGNNFDITPTRKLMINNISL